jgi:hypothetical protein
VEGITAFIDFAFAGFETNKSDSPSLSTRYPRLIGCDPLHLPSIKTHVEQLLKREKDKKPTQCLDDLEERNAGLEKLARIGTATHEQAKRIRNGWRITA